MGQAINTLTGEPVANAQVTVVGTQRGSLTDARGNFVVTGVTPGTRPEL